MAMVLVSNLLGASRLEAADGDEEGEELLAVHDALVSHELKTHGATLVEPLDDGLLGLFPVPEASPVRVVACALRIVQRLEEDGVPVRMGLDAGEIALTRKGLRGEALDSVIEVVRNAAPGEVLVAEAARKLVTRTGQRFTDLGEHEIDLTGDPVHLFRAEPLAGPRYGP